MISYTNASSALKDVRWHCVARDAVRRTGAPIRETGRAEDHGFIPEPCRPVTMPDLHPIAKRIHNVQPRPVRLTLDDGDSGVYEFSSTEFFQQEFRGEGERTDDDVDAEFRLITSEDNESVLLGRSGPDEDGWTVIGEIVEAERAGE